MTNDSTEPSVETERPLERRLLLRGGAVLAGAAGATVIGAALGSPRAEASTGDAVTAGQANAAGATTSLTIDATDDTAPALALTNDAGPSLRLTPVGSDYNGGLKAGDIAFTPEGPEVGVSDGLTSTTTTFLATGLDLDQIPFALAIPPVRLLDTRTAAGRDSIRTTSPRAFDSSHRLKAGSWMDVAVFPSDLDVSVEAVFVNVVVVKPVLGGFLTVYPPGDRPDTSTLNFAADRNVANGAFILAGVADEDNDWYVVRVYSSATAHVILDWTGATVYGVAGPGASQRRNTNRNAVRAKRMRRVLR